MAGGDGGDPRQLLVDSRSRIGCLQLPLQGREREEEEEEKVRDTGRTEHEIPTSIASIAAQTLDLSRRLYVRTVCWTAQLLTDTDTRPLNLTDTFHSKC